MSQPNVLSASNITTRNADVNLRNIDLIGYTMHQITGAKLPSNRQVLAVLFYNMRFVNLTAKESAKLTLKAVQIFWEQARIPIRNQDKCISKLLKLYEAWKNIQKTISEKRSISQKQNVDEFVQSLDDLFDIASADALTKMRISDDRTFLEMQRQKGRPGCMMGVDKTLHDREIRALERQEKATERKRKYHANSEVLTSLSDNDLDEDDGSVSLCNNVEDIIPLKNSDIKPYTNKQRGSKNIFTSRLLSALDNAKVSDGMAVHILIATAEALGHSVKELSINRSTLHRMRQQNRNSQFNEISTEFTDKANTNGAFVVHFDGKFMPDVKGRHKVERIAVLLSYNGMSKFLGAPKLDSSSGVNIAEAVYGRLVDWKVVDQVKAISYDTTAVNTGVKAGAAVLLEKKLKHKVIHLPCRHHIYEIVLRHVFESKLSLSPAPEVAMFERFAKFWPNINKELIKTGIEDEVVSLKIDSNDRECIVTFLQKQLTLPHIRDDYKELIQLSLYFLGAARFNLCTPSATSHARWMAKSIYSLKIFLLRDQFTLPTEDLNCLREICIFIVKIYIKPWFGCTNAIAAPAQDINFIKNAIEYCKTDPTISAAIIKKMSNHLWYLGEEIVGLAFFDENVSHVEKKKMISKLKCKQPHIKLKNGRSHSNVMNLHSCELADFVSEKTKQLFDVFGLSSSFLESDPSEWNETQDFEESWTFCRNLQVTNDTAERGIKFIQDYNRILTNDEDEK